MNKNKLIHDFLDVVSRGDVECICGRIPEVHSVLGNLDFQHPQTGNTPLITAAEENLSEVQWGGRKKESGGKQGGFAFGFLKLGSFLFLHNKFLFPGLAKP